MSGIGNRQGLCSDEGHTGYIATLPDNGGSRVVPAKIDIVRGARKIVVEGHDSVCYPVVTRCYADDWGESVDVNKMAMLDSEKVAASEMDEAPAGVNEESTVSLTDVIESTDETRQQGGRFKKWWSRFGTLVVAGIVIMAVTLVGLRLAGFRTFTVMSGSMEPNYPVGSMLYVQPRDYRELKVGDVISYVANDDKTVVTHRIVEIMVDPDDSSILRFKTKGDANAAADSGAVHYKNVLGVPVITVPFIGYFAHNIQQPPGVYIALVVGTLLLAWTFLPGTLEERRRTARKSIVS